MSGRRLGLPCRLAPRRSVAELVRRRRQVTSKLPARCLAGGEHRLLDEPGTGKHPAQRLAVSHECVLDRVDDRDGQVVLLVEAPAGQADQSRVGIAGDRELDALLGRAAGVQQEHTCKPADEGTRRVGIGVQVDHIGRSGKVPHAGLSVDADRGTAAPIGDTGDC